MRDRQEWQARVATRQLTPARLRPLCRQRVLKLWHVSWWRFDFSPSVTRWTSGFSSAMTILASKRPRSVVVAAIAAFNFPPSVAFRTVLRCHKFLSLFRDYALAVATRALACPVAKLALGVIEETCLTAPAALGATSFSFAARTLFYICHCVTFLSLNADPFGVVFASVVFEVIDDCHYRKKQTCADYHSQANSASDIFICSNDVRNFSGGLKCLLTASAFLPDCAFVNRKFGRT